jgi:sodium-independent sulfate anion transporter 11
MGVSNFFGSFIGTYPVTGSFSRSAVKHHCNVKSTGSSIVTGIVVIIALVATGPAFKYIPNACLAAITIVAAMSIFDWQVWNGSFVDVI